MSSIGYLIKQGLRNLIQHSVLSMASIGVLFICLLLMGGSALFSLNLNKVISDIERQNEVVVFLRDESTQCQIDEVTDILNSIDYIETFLFKDKTQALKDYISIIGGNQELYESLKDDNPLPNTYNIVLLDLSRMDEFIDKMESISIVEKVNAPVEVANMIVGIKHAINIAGLVMISVLFLVSLIIISNTIKLTIYSRRKEINIMKFVGASDMFIRLPFMVEGISIGLISAVLAHLTIWSGYNKLIAKLGEVKLQWVINLYNNMIVFSDYNIYIFSGFLLIGLISGLIGSIFFVRKYLRV